MYRLLLHPQSPHVHMYSAGVDYVRLTTRSHADETDILRIYRAAGASAMAEVHEGAVEWEPWAWQGYYGQRGTGVAYGSGAQGCLFQASGAAAYAAVSHHLPWDNVARLDIQYTVWLDIDDTQMAERLSGISRAAAQMANGGRWKVRRIDGGEDGDTLYIGSREGEMFVRVYDKYRESGQNDEYRNAWRFEVEAKDGLARSLWPDAGAPWPSDAYWARVVSNLLRRRGIALRPPPDAAPVAEVTYRKEQSSTDRRLAWLRSQVAPSIAKLTAAGVSRETILGALLLDAK